MGIPHEQRQDCIVRAAWYVTEKSNRYLVSGVQREECELNLDKQRNIPGQR